MVESKPKILVLIDWYLPGYKAGGPIQSISNLIEALKDHFEFAVITKNKDHRDPIPYADVPANEWFTRPEGTRVYYFSEEYFSYKRLKQLIASEKPDFVYLNSMYSVPFTMMPIWMGVRSKAGYTLVLATRGMLHAGAVKIKSLKKTVFLRLFSLLGLPKHIRWQATDAQEKQDIQAFFGNNLDIRVVSNLPKQAQAPHNTPPKQQGEVRFIFSSRVSKKKNIEFFLQQLKQHTKSKLSFDVYGAFEDPDYLTDCQKIAHQLPANISVRFLGEYLPEKLADIMQSYHFFVLTTQGENFGHAIFEGLLSGKPIILSDQTPWRNLETQRIGWDIPLSKPEEFQRVIQQCVDMEQEEYNQLSLNAWNFAKEYKSSPQLVQQYLHLFSR